MVCNDARARHVLEACRRIAVRVPEDIAIVSVDDDALICESTSPPLTSIDLGGCAVGHTAARVLDTLMSGRSVRQRWIVVEPQGLVCRQSSDIFAVRDVEVSQALRFIHDHACGDISVREVIQKAAMSRSTFERRFKAILGRTVHDEIERVRLQLACQLVSQTDSSLKEVCRQVGFKHLGHFTTVFRRRLGKTPAVYRRELRMR